nr:unnamed protein product [Callosobruchus analis]
MKIKDLKVNYFSKLVTVKGTVIKAGQVKLVCQYLAFQCCSCGGTQMVRQTDGAYTPPARCPTRGCHSQKHFVPLHTSRFNRIITWQSMKIQELLGIEQCDGARIPRSLDCELTEDLVKCCIPGDDVTVTGIVKVRDSNSNNGCNKQHTIFNIYLEAVSICNDKKQARRDVSSDGMTFNVSDCHLIQEIHSQPNLFKYLVHSLCPSIYGHEVVKAGLLLSLFGGTKSETFRGESHVLVVGDPGLGKSQMLQACANVAPRGVYVCGNTSTSSGLTVTVTREGNEFAMEAGALMLADQGTCCIDEFDKMSSQHAQMDLLLSRHVLSLHKVSKIKSNVNEITFDDSDMEQNSFRERLRSTGENIDYLPHPLFRKYIAYAQKYVKPYLSDEAKEIIKEFYLSLRKQFKTGDCTPITTRQLNSLIRLTQARAKVELREEATRDDAKDVIELMKFSLVDVFTDSSGVLDKTRSQIGTGMSTKNQVMRLLTLIQRKSDAEAKSVFKTSELKELSEQLGMEKTKFYQALQTLNIQGFILNKGQNQYQLVTAV